MKRTLCIFLLFLFSFTGFAQVFTKINKLESSLNSETDHKKLTDKFYELSVLYASSDSKKAMENAQRSLTISKSLLYEDGEVNAYNQIGKLERKIAHYQAALDAHYNALRINERLKNQEKIALSNLYIGQVYQEKGEFDIAENFYTNALKLGKKMNSSFVQSRGNSLLADLNHVQGKNNLAIQYYLMALEAISLTNNITEKGTVNQQIGNLYKASRQKEKALYHFSESLKDFEKTNNKEKQAVLYFEMGEIYQEQGQFELALLYMKNSLGLAEKTGLKAYIKKGYENLANVYDKNGDYELAYEYLKYYIAIKDTREISELEAQLELEKKSQEILLLNKEKEFKAIELKNKNFSTNIILLVFFIVIILAIFLFFSLKQKNKINVELKIANEDAHRSRKEKEEFFAYTSHEIRTPLNAVVGMSKLLAETDLDTGQQNYLKTINSSAQNILFLVNDVLDLSKIESGAIELETVDFSLHDIIGELINSLQFKIRDKNIQLVPEIDSTIPIVLMGDPFRINQILLNLVDNAIKFTTNGEIRIKLSAIGKDEKTISILFQVSDTGIGIRKSRLDSIFDSFKQETTHTTRQYGGTGLGLAITKNLIQLMGSKINLDSTYGEGSIFYFELKLKKSKHKSLKVGMSQTKTSLKDLKILVVDDNHLNREIFFDLINDYKNNVAVDMADDGKMALLKIKQSEYDVVLMDIQMPKLDGYQATRQIRKLKNKKANIPIIAMTAHVLEGVAEKCKKAGMNDYVSKPINTKLLTQVIKKHVVKKNIETKENKVTEQGENGIFLETAYVNLTDLLQLINNDYAKLEKYIGIFFNNVPSDLENLKEAFEAHKWEDLGKIAHKMKGNVGYMGIHSIKEELLILEKVNKEVGDLEEIADIVNRVEIVVELAIKELKEIRTQLKEKI